MSGVRVEFSVVDKFSQAIDRFSDMINACAGIVDELSNSSSGADKKMKDLGDNAKSVSNSFGGFGGSMLILNQAMQAFQRLAEPISQALDDIGDKERALIILGREAGTEFNTFASNAARSLGLVEGEVRRAGLEWRNIGVGGQGIIELTKLTERFANLNPSKSFTDVAETFKDAVKSHSVGGLAELLGGGEGVERALQRAGVERALNRGDVDTALKKFQLVADRFGYTQERADEMGNTIDKSVKKIGATLKTYSTDLFSSVVSEAEPYIHKLQAWLNSDDFKKTFIVIKSAVVAATRAFFEMVDVVVKFTQEAVLAVNSFMDTAIRIIVGSGTGIVGSVVFLAQNLWNTLININEGGINLVVKGVEWMINGAISMLNGLRDRAIDIAKSIITTVTDMIEKVSNSFLGEKLGFGDAVDDLKKISSYIDDVKADKISEVSFKGVDFSDFKADVIDVFKFSEEAIDGAISGVHSLINSAKDSIFGGVEFGNNDILDQLTKIGNDTTKIRGSMTHQQDLRWMKEMAEQRFVNQVNVRQLTPTIQVRVVGANQSPKAYADEIARTLRQQAAAGTFNAYGEIG